MDTGNWKLVLSEAVSIPVYWPGQERKESDTGMRSKFECSFCGLRKSWWHKKGITPDVYNYCPQCGERMLEGDIYEPLQYREQTMQYCYK